MFEFELRGNMEDLIQLERELLQHLGFKTPEGTMIIRTVNMRMLLKVMALKNLKTNMKNN